VFENRDALARSPRHDLALDCLRAGVEAAHPDRVVREAVAVEGDRLRVGDERVDLSAVDRALVVGGGNAAGAAAAAVESVLGDRLDGGVVVTDDPADCERVRVRAGDHPVPTERNVAATRAVLDLAREAGADDLVLAVVTGGGSALLAAPAVPLADLRTTTEALLDSPATIDEINAVRKHLSAVKGGGLARAAAPARVVGVVFSDVVGDDPGTVASGPTAPDPTTFADALAVLERHDVAVPESVRSRLAAGAAGDHPETPAGGVAGASNVVVANGLTALTAAADRARAAGYEPLVLSSRVRGEAREAAKSAVAVAEEVAASGHPVDPPAALLSGGEVTVASPGDAPGGPNQEFGLSGALELRGDGTVLAAIDTDGVDGNSDAAGALVDGGTVQDPARAREALAAHASGPYLAARDAAVRTGPTGTNVNDLRVLVVR